VLLSEHNVIILITRKIVGVAVVEIVIIGADYVGRRRRYGFQFIVMYVVCV